MPNEEAKLFVAGLPDSISEDVLKQIFEATGGTVVNVSLPKDRQSGRPRGFGFVTLSTPGEAQNARDALDGSIQAGKSISVRPFQAEPPRRGEGGIGAGPEQQRAAKRTSRRRWWWWRPRRGRGAPIERCTSATSLTTAPSKRSKRSSTAFSTARVKCFACIFLWTKTAASRGFGFVTMASAGDRKERADALKTADLRGRRLVVTPRTPQGRTSPATGRWRWLRAEWRRLWRRRFRRWSPQRRRWWWSGLFQPHGQLRRSPSAAQTFDERSRKKHGSAHNEDGPRKRRFEKEDRGGRADDDWTGGGGSDDD